MSQDHGYSTRTHTRRPSNLSTEGGQGFDENCGLDGPSRSGNFKDITPRQTGKYETDMWRHPAIRAPLRG